VAYSKRVKRTREAQRKRNAGMSRKHMTHCHLTDAEVSSTMPALMSDTKRNMIQISPETRQALEVEQERLMRETGYKHALGKIVDRWVSVLSDPAVREAVDRALSRRSKEKP
jgi:hypothetical protein